MESIFEAIVNSRDPYTQAELTVSLQALAKVQLPFLNVNLIGVVLILTLYYFNYTHYRLRSSIFLSAIIKF